MSEEFRNPPTIHCHQNSLDTGSTPESFAERELELGSGTLTVTDHGTLSACRRIYDLALSKGLTPLIGHEAYLRDDNCPILKANGFDVPKEYAKYFHVTTLFLNQTAYETASKVISRAPYERHGSESKPLFNWADFEEMGAQDTIIGSGCLIGLTQRHLLNHNRPDIAEAYYQRMRSIVKPNNFFVEIFPHKCDTNWVSGLFIEVNDGDKITRHKYHLEKKLRTNVGEVDAKTLLREFNSKNSKHITLDAVKNYSKWDEREPAAIVKVEFLEDYFHNPCTTESPDGDVQKWGNTFVMEMAKKYGDLIVMSDDSHFATPEYKVAQDVRLMSGGGSWRMSESYHRKSGVEQWEHFKTRMGTPRLEFDRWVDNAFGLAERFKDFKFNYKPELPTKFYPANTLEELKRLIGKHGRMQWDKDTYRKRLEEEIHLFHSNGVVDFLPYFFFCEEACDIYRKAGLLSGAGRGSGAGVLIAYLLGITQVDPIRSNLSLERFLTIDRIKAGTFPDLDLDFCDRSLLVGGEEEYVVCTMDNGETKEFRKGEMVATILGNRKIEDAVSEGLKLCE